ncbi:MAG: hypothetical protein QOH97_5303 [Actinoplanes sp.]|jgi:hypothetical protein|nr:hypothetical protein [Actinoplanes sp.]
MALSKRQAEQVAKEKERASLNRGDSPAKAKKYADEVRAYAAKERAKGGKR